MEVRAPLNKAVHLYLHSFEDHVGVAACNHSSCMHLTHSLPSSQLSFTSLLPWVVTDDPRSHQPKDEILCYLQNGPIQVFFNLMSGWYCLSVSTFPCTVKSVKATVKVWLGHLFGQLSSSQDTSTEGESIFFPYSAAVGDDMLRSASRFRTFFQLAKQATNKLASG